MFKAYVRHRSSSRGLGQVQKGYLLPPLHAIVLDHLLKVAAAIRIDAPPLYGWRCSSLGEDDAVKWPDMGKVTLRLEKKP